ncbi:hypothetical protein [Actinocatenispora comari]|uniref:Uncharacterized protein n=1 Tax=Actinocatenispora comari TaxID=2807577 RepID=A0A8J4A879_9ACTN|nr:hypothetical protein [Actinocatenispora comari]GIL25489.1 hypothetical protein NUM_07440 [Actinocatenispora comari]
MNSCTPSGIYYRSGFEDDCSTDAIPDKYPLTINSPDGEELAVDVHRTCGGRYPLGGPTAEYNRHHAAMIRDALNRRPGTATACPPHDAASLAGAALHTSPAINVDRRR